MSSLSRREFALLLSSAADAKLPGFRPGPVNSYRLGSVAFYCDPAGSARHLLLTHARRELAAMAEPAVRSGAALVAPEAERTLLEQPQQFWQRFAAERFHDYAQLDTKLPARPLHLSRAVRPGETLRLDDYEIHVLDARGFTRGAVAYLIETARRRIIVSGDLIFAGGRLLDLYTLQDAIPEAKTRGYHGYAARAADLIASLRRMAEQKPHLLIPARGPLIVHPQRDIRHLIDTLQRLLESHFSTDALRWYWGDDNLLIRARSALQNRKPPWMTMALLRPLPEWILPIGNSRLILSRSGRGLLIDGGYRSLPAELEKLRHNGRLAAIDVIWITHYHDDHTDYIPQLAARWGATVRFTSAMQDILRRPAAYRMPCLPTVSIEGLPMAHGASFAWQEFQLGCYFFPGQTLYHGGLHLKRDSGEEIFFVGDSFTPTGLDDYCLYNRDFLTPGQGYLFCLDLLERFPQAWLINQHVEPMFQFEAWQRARMRAELLRRAALLDHISWWPDRNFMLDHAWARIDPYGLQLAPGSEFTLELQVLNHSPRPQPLEVRWHAPAPIQLLAFERARRIQSRTEATLRARFRALHPGLHLITATLRFAGHHLPEWTEALVEAR